MVEGVRAPWKTGDGKRRRRRQLVNRKAQKAKVKSRKLFLFFLEKLASFQDT